MQKRDGITIYDISFSGLVGERTGLKADHYEDDKRWTESGRYKGKRKRLGVIDQTMVDGVEG